MVKVKLDNIDLKILTELQHNGKISNVNLSELISISPSPCLRRVKNLEKHGIIEGYFTKINEKYFDISLVIFASVVVETKDEEEKILFEKELSTIPEVREIYNLASGNDYLLKIITKGWSDYKYLISSQMSKVPYIKKIRTTHISKVVKSEFGFHIK